MHIDIVNRDLFAKYCSDCMHGAVATVGNGHGGDVGIGNVAENCVLDALREDREKSRRMLPDGSYVRDPGGEGTSSQEALYRYFSSLRVSVEEPGSEAADSNEGGFFNWLKKLFAQ